MISFVLFDCITFFLSTVVFLQLTACGALVFDTDVGEANRSGYNTLNHG